MAENNDVPEVPDENQTTEVEAVPEAAADVPAPQAGPVLVPRIRDRVWSFRAVLAVGVAALLIGGAGGAAVVAATGDDHGDRHRIGRFGPPDGQRGPGGPGFGYGGGQQLRQDGPRSGVPAPPAS